MGNVAGCRCPNHHSKAGELLGTFSRGQQWPAVANIQCTQCTQCTQSQERELQEMPLQHTWLRMFQGTKTFPEGDRSGWQHGCRFVAFPSVKATFVSVLNSKTFRPISNTQRRMDLMAGFRSVEVSAFLLFQGLHCKKK